MSNNTTYVGRKMRRFDTAKEFEAYGSVKLTTPDGETSGGEIGGGSAGHLPGMPTHGGLALSAEIPWKTAKMSSNMLQQILGFKYQPFTAEGALLDPAAELGDGITANNVYSGIYTRTINFGTNTTATVSAPIGEDLDHEFPYVPKQERKVQRRLHGLATQLTVTDGKISAEVSNLESKMHTELAARDGEIAAKVSKTGGTESKSFGWVLTDESWKVQNNGKSVFEVTENGAMIKGIITATSGSIGGFDINSKYLSYNKQTWEGTVSNGIYIGQEGIQLGNKKFVVTKKGELICKGGTFEGKITAKSGSIGGFTINSSQLSTNDQGWANADAKETGIYIGKNGIRLGKNFKVSASGEITATDGDFSGTVKANKIVWNDKDEDSKLPGSALKLSSVGSGILSEGVNTSLGYANFANGVFDGKERATKGTFVNLDITGYFKMNDNMFGVVTRGVLDGNGNPVTIQYLGLK